MRSAARHGGGPTGVVATCVLVLVLVLGAVEVAVAGAVVVAAGTLGVLAAGLAGAVLLAEVLPHAATSSAAAVKTTRFMDTFSRTEA